MAKIIQFSRRVADPAPDAGRLLRALGRLAAKARKAESARQLRELGRSLRRGDAKRANRNGTPQDHTEAIAKAVRLDRDLRQARGRALDAVARGPTW